MITQERLHEMFEYRDGNLYRKISLGRTKAGDKVGFINDKGYVSVNIDKQCIALHRLIWMMQYGCMPEIIDHIDCNKTNNRIENLRQATKSQNAHNRLIQKNNKSGVKCIHKFGKKWRAMITVQNKQKHLGMFESIENAKEFVDLAREMLHENFANHGTITQLQADVAALKGQA